MALSISVAITGDQAFMQKFAAFGASLTDFSVPLKKVGEALINYYSGEVFQSQGTQFGTPWAQLSPSTIAFKSKHYQQYAALPLVATGTMQHSFRSTVSPRKLVIDNTAPYFVYHQSSAPRSKLPRRQMIGVDEHIKGVVKQIISDDIHMKLGRL